MNRKKSPKPSFSHSFRRFSIWAQLTLLVTGIIAVAFGFIIYTTYTRQVHSFVEEYRSRTQTLLDMESSNLDQYLKDLRNFCVRPCLNVPVYNSLLKTGALSPKEQEAIRQEIQSEYHSRTDLRSYAITALGSGLKFERPVTGQHVLMYSSGNIRHTTPFEMCGSNDKYEYMEPSEDPDTFFRYYHYLIRLRNREPISLSRVDVNTTELKLLLSNHTQSGEALCLYNPQGEVLYTNLPQSAEGGTEDFGQLYTAALSQDSMVQNGETWLLTKQHSKETGLLLLSLMPQSTLSARAKSFLNPMLLTGIGIILLVMAVLALVLHMLTDPLTKLSRQMSLMGEGDFSPMSFRSGCRESDNLTQSYNEMALKLNELIETNYIANLNEKNARLKALEAQLNPHFLYNTLQAIATEALVAGCPDVYDMIVSLAANLRYTIKGDQLVPLENELTYVRNYVLLQKTRLGSRLEVTEEIAPDALAVRIPKISVQLLVENAILHGMPQDGRTLQIQIRAQVREEQLCITVFDNGVGITEEHMRELNHQLAEQSLSSSDPETSIGLRNLASRLRILYQGNASLTVESNEGEFTSATMTLNMGE